MNKILLTELLLHFRRSQAWLYPIAFFIILLSLFPLAFTPDPAFLQKYVPGCIWIAALLSSLLSVENIFMADLEDGYLEQLLLSEHSLTISLIAKLGAQWIVSLLPLILLTPVIGLMFGLSLLVISSICLGLLFGTPILLLIGSFCVALTIGLKQHGAILGLMILPLVTPVLIFGVNLTQQAQAGFSMVAALAFLAGLCLLSMTLLPAAIGAALRVSVDD